MPENEIHEKKGEAKTNERNGNESRIENSAPSKEEEHSAIEELEGCRKSRNAEYEEILTSMQTLREYKLARESLDEQKKYQEEYEKIEAMSNEGKYAELHQAEELIFGFTNQDRADMPMYNRQESPEKRKKCINTLLFLLRQFGKTTDQIKFKNLVKLSELDLHKAAETKGLWVACERGLRVTDYESQNLVSLLLREGIIPNEYTTTMEKKRAFFVVLSVYMPQILYSYNPKQDGHLSRELELSGMNDIKNMVEEKTTPTIMRIVAKELDDLEALTNQDRLERIDRLIQIGTNLYFSGVLFPTSEQIKLENDEIVKLQIKSDPIEMVEDRSILVIEGDEFEFSATRTADKWKKKCKEFRSVSMEDYTGKMSRAEIEEGPKAALRAIEELPASSTILIQAHGNLERRYGEMENDHMTSPSLTKYGTATAIDENGDIEAAGTTLYTPRIAESLFVQAKRNMEELKGKSLLEQSPTILCLSNCFSTDIAFNLKKQLEKLGEKYKDVELNLRILSMTERGFTLYYTIGSNTPPAFVSESNGTTIGDIRKDHLKLREGNMAFMEIRKKAGSTTVELNQFARNESQPESGVQVA